LLRWTLENRDKLIGAALTLINHWIAEGKPGADAHLGSFEEWSDVIGGILGCAGIPGFLDNLKEFYEDADAEGRDIRMFVQVWWENLKDKVVGGKELHALIKDNEIPLYLGRASSEQGEKIYLGQRVLQKIKGRQFGQLRVEDMGVSKRAYQFRVVKVENEPKPSKELQIEDLPESKVLVSLEEDSPEDSPTRIRMNSTKSESGESGESKMGSERARDLFFDLHNKYLYIRGKAKIDSPDSPDSPNLLFNRIYRGLPTVSPNSKTHQTHAKSLTLVNEILETNLPKLEKQKDPERAQRLAAKVLDEVESYFSIMWGSAFVTALHERASPYQVAEHVRNHGIRTIYMDTETTSLVMHAGELSLVQVLAGSEVFLLPPTGDFIPLRELIEDSEIKVVLHGSTFDLGFLQAHLMPDLRPTNIWDTKVGERILCGGLEIGYSLKDLASRYSGIELVKDKKLTTSFRPGEPLSDKQILYAAMDVIVLPGIHWSQNQALWQVGLMDLAKFQMDLIPAVLAVSTAGIGVDVAQLEKKREELKVILASAEAHVKELLGQEINIRSPVQLIPALKALGVKVKSTNKKSLTRVKHPVGKALLQYKQYHKEYSGFVKGYLNRVNRASGRLYGNFQQVGTVTGRFSCQRPNLQQVPRNGGLRNAFVAADGYCFVIGDLGQIELRIAAELSRDPELIQLFQDGRDFHSETAARVFVTEEIDSEMRNKAKAINFGISYGMGISSLADHIGSSEEEAKHFRRKYFQPYKHWQRYRRAAGSLAMESKYSTTFWGRIRYYNSPRSNQWSDWQLRNRGMNTPIQAGCGDIFKLALHWLHQRLDEYDARVVNLIHDEVIVEVHERQVDEVKDIVQQTLIEAGEYFIKRVPVVADVEVRQTWAKSI
jgi:DNA polymerase I-like protein with 3'-5' exonuclease and polymerase domains